MNVCLAARRVEDTMRTNALGQKRNYIGKRSQTVGGRKSMYHIQAAVVMEQSCVD